MNSPLFKFNLSELLQSLANAVVGALIFAVAGYFQQDGFSIFTANWVEIGKSAVDAAVIVFVSTLSTFLLTTKEGKVLGAVQIK